MPVGHVLVCDTGGNIEHDDTALAVDVVAITETTELLLAGSVPDVELNLAKVLRCVRAAGRALSLARLTYGGEAERVDLDTERGHILLLELSRQVALDEGGLRGVSSD